MTDDTIKHDDDALPKTWARGLPPHEPTDETRAQVEALVSFGVQQDQIALFLEIDTKTLRKYYRRELDTGTIRANAKVAARLFKSATEEGIPASMFFWLKCRAGWRDVSQPTTDDPTALVPTTITVERKDARLAQ